MKKWLAVLCTALLAQALLVPARASAQAPLHMVTMGDSYASGVGAGDYRQNTVGACWRSLNSTGEVLARWLAEYGEVALSNVTCSGAKIDDVRREQLAALRPETLLVLLTVGGNDIGFSKVAGQCLAPNMTCAGGPIAGALAKLPGMSGKLSLLLREIKQRSPRAKIVVVGYGQPVAAGPNAPGTPGVELDPICGPEYLTSEERKGAADLSAALDFTLRATVEWAKRQEGTTASYVSPYEPWSRILDPRFVGRSVCDTMVAKQYYRGLDALAPPPPNGVGDEAHASAVLHGNRPGYEVMAELVVTEAPEGTKAFTG